MKNLLIAIFIFYPIILFCQKGNSFEIYASPNFTYYTKSLVNDKAVVTYNFGVGYNYKRSEKMDWTVGLRFADFSTKYSNDNLRWGTQHDGNGGFDPNLPGGPVTGLTFKHHYYFLEMPIGIKYKLLENKVHVFIEPTINPAMFLTHRTDIEKRYDQQPDRATISSGGYTSLRKFNFFGELGIGIGIPLSEKLDLHIRPSARIQLLSAAEKSFTNARLYSFGVKLGVNYLLVGQ